MRDYTKYVACTCPTPDIHSLTRRTVEQYEDQYCRCCGRWLASTITAALDRQLGRRIATPQRIAPEPAPVPTRADRELCASCRYTYAGHISNTGNVYPCWKPSGIYQEE